MAIQAQDKILNALATATSQKDIRLEIPSNPDHGDYSSNIALTSAKKLKKNPLEYANEIKSLLSKDKQLDQTVSEIKTVAPGFINFYLSNSFLLKNLKNILEGREPQASSSRKIMVEYAHPNTHKSFHIGHLRNIITGEAVSRLLESQGFEVKRVNYQGDIGLHIAKAIYGIELLGFKDAKDVIKRIDFLAQAYVAGNKAYEEDKAKDKINKINKSLYQKDSKYKEVYQKTRSWSLDYFDSIYKRVGTKFDRLYFESEVAQSGLKYSQEAQKKGILESSQGALVYKGEKEGLHTRVFITSQNTPTYEAKDLALAKLQYDEFEPEKIIHIVGPEQKGYFQVVFNVVEKLHPQLKGKELHIPYGWVKLKKGKMSSRSGNVVLGEWLINEAKKRISKEFKNVSSKTAEIVALGAIKYSFLKHGIEQEIAFDFDESIALEGNSGPYLQYTYARTQSVLTKSKFKNLKTESENTNDDEQNLLRIFSQFSGITSTATKSYSPNILAEYLFKLAQSYNSFYNANKIINSDNENFRLALTKATGDILKTGLELLGIQAPDKM